MLRSIVITGALAVGACLGPIPAALAQQGLVPCAQEHGFCSVPFPTRVFYGVTGRMTARFVSPPGIACSNQVFGDPAQGTPKLCAYATAGAGAGAGELAPGGDRRGSGRSRSGDFGPGDGDRRGYGGGGYGASDGDRRGYGSSVGGGYGAGGGGEARGGGANCRELRQACLSKEQLGERGEGNCRTYRSLCQ